MHFVRTFVRSSVYNIQIHIQHINSPNRIQTNKSRQNPTTLLTLHRFLKWRCHFCVCKLNIVFERRFWCRAQRQSAKAYANTLITCIILMRFFVFICTFCVVSVWRCELREYISIVLYVNNMFSWYTGLVCTRDFI